MSQSPVNVSQETHEVIANHFVTLMLIRFDSSFLLWVGQPPPNSRLDHLALAIGNNSTDILPGNTNLLSDALAKRLSAKYNDNRPVYVSYNYPETGIDHQVVVKINEQIVDFLDRNLVS